MSATSGSDDTSSESTDAAPQQLCFEAWTFPEITSDERTVDLDLDGDGLDELWRASPGSVDAYALSDGAWTSETSSDFAGSFIEMADVDGDGRKDVVARPFDGRTIGAAQFHAIATDGVPSEAGTPFEYDGSLFGWFIDLDGDGDDDVLEFFNDQQLLEVRLNDRTQFVSQPDVDVSELITGSNWLNGVVPLSEGRVLLEFSAGSGSLGNQLVWFDESAGQLSALPGEFRQLVAVEDIDGDGDRDVVWIEEVGDVFQVVVDRQDGRGFEREVLSTRDVHSAALGDFEERGSPQLLLRTSDSELFLLRIDTREELPVSPLGDTQFSRLRGSANYEGDGADEAYIELCELTCAAGYARISPC